ncbi:MAG TPA: aminoacyl-tRNA hydrolase [Candidatus Sulfomarinibacteraceae bacterium]|nr:aminoacyl-tRNA hydrolase [Candidatus Sulfomarinibacteraceae bacterium]
MTQHDGERRLIVGLGNPGRKHRNNRHNIGFMAIDRLAAAHHIELSRVQSKAVIGTGRIGQQPVILAKPQTYMNRSGDSVGPIAHYYRIDPQAVLVVYDELDLPLGALRLREQGGSGGHNGMKSIIQHLGNNFPRLRLGIGRPPGRMPPAAYVLQDFGADEEPVVDELLVGAVEAIETFLHEGIGMAMSRHNGQIVEPPANN